MDDVERMYRHLVRAIRSNSPQLLTQPFQVADLYATILPYRLHRRDLGLETNQDYEMAMLELLSGARGYLVVEDRMRDVLGASLKSSNPDPQLIREFASTRVSLSPDGLRQYDPDALAAATATAQTAPAGVPAADTESVPGRVAAGGTAPASSARSARAAASPSAPPAPRSGTAASPSAPSAATRRPSRPITIAPTGESCPHCKGELPAGRQINFCPHCGQDLTIQHCPACGSELEHGWKFCVTCGRAAAGV
ncbi:MAG TPA: zinc ribbon domain-containing protein [Gemmatimonadaceae bacterium]|nr:zinc ribbon domain-containing protein [Gemmatimonadaceae bacterium]